MFSKTKAEEVFVIRFFRDFMNFGSFSHLFAVEAFEEMVQNTQSMRHQKILAVKAYAEFMSSIEDFGALCIAVRHRNDNFGLVHSYLLYNQRRRKDAPTTTIQDFYQDAASGKGVSSLLCLPSLDNILDRLPEMKDTIMPELYKELNILLPKIGKLYEHEGKAYIRAYNKIKHGFVVVEEEGIFSSSPGEHLEEAWIISEKPIVSDQKKEGKPGYELFSVKPDIISPLADRIRLIRGAVFSLCGLVVFLLINDIIESKDAAY